MKPLSSLVASFLLLSSTAFGSERRFGLDEPEFLLLGTLAESHPSKEQGEIVMGDSVIAPPLVLPSHTKHFSHLPIQMAGAFGGAIAGAYVLSGALGAIVEDDDYDSGDEITAVALGVLLGYPLGAAAGAHFTGGEGGSFHHALAGAAAGILVGALLAEPTDGWSLIVGIPLGAVWGWNDFPD